MTHNEMQDRARQDGARQDRQLLDEIAAELTQSQPLSNDELAFETLRTILFGEYHGQIDQLQIDLNRLRSTFDQVDQQFKSDEMLAQRMAPIIAPAIMTSIHESRAVMVEALYPIMGQMVVRAVTEAMRDLARRIDYQMRSTLSIGLLLQQWQARLRGVQGDTLLLRGALPFDVQEIFLIHRDSGLLLHHLAHDPEIHLDSDLISSMLTAIHDFAQNVLGHDAEDQLNQIQYGNKVILLEAAQKVYIAVVIQGIEPSGYRAEMRKQAIDINLAHKVKLHNYDGDASHFSSLSTQLADLMLATDGKIVASKIIEVKKAKRKAANLDITALPTNDWSNLSWHQQALPNGLFVISILVTAAFLLLLLLWQLQSAPASLFSLSTRSIF